MNALFIILFIIIVGLFGFLVWFISQSMKNESGEKKEKTEKVELVHDNVLLHDELKEFSDEVLSKIDHRMASLRKLIKEADDRIKTLERLSSTARPEQAPLRAASSEPEDEEDSQAGGRGGGTDRRTAIMRLARRGTPVEQIAREVGMGRGEVELIVSIENSRKRA